MAITVGGVMANLALRHNIGKRVVTPGKRGNRVRVNRKERIQLSELLSKAHKKGATRRAKERTNGVTPETPEVFSAGPTEETMKAAKEPQASFYGRLAFDTRLPTDVRMEAFVRMARSGDAAEGG